MTPLSEMLARELTEMVEATDVKAIAWIQTWLESKPDHGIRVGPSRPVLEPAPGGTVVARVEILIVRDTSLEPGQIVFDRTVGRPT